MQKLQDKLAQEKLTKEKEFQEKLAKLQEEEDNRVQREMAQFEVELEESENKLKEEAKRKLAKLNKDNNDFLESQDKKLEDEIEQIKAKGAKSGKSEYEVDQEIDQLMEEHKNNLMNYNKNLESNREKIQEQLNRRLKNRKQKKLADKQEKLDQEANENLDKLHEAHKNDINELIDEVNEKLPAETGKMPTSTSKTDVVESTRDTALPRRKASVTPSIVSTGPDFTGILSNLSNIKSTLTTYDPNQLSKAIKNAENSGDGNKDKKAASQDFPYLANFKPIPVEVGSLTADLTSKHDFLKYISKLLTVTNHVKFSKLITILPCDNLELPGVANLDISSGYYYDEINAIIWINQKTLKSVNAAKLCIDVCKIIAKANETTYTNALTILAKNVYLNLMAEGADQGRKVKTINVDLK